MITGIAFEDFNGVGQRVSIEHRLFTLLNSTNIASGNLAA